MATMSMPMWRRSPSDGSVMFVRKRQINEMIERAPKPSPLLRDAIERRRRLGR